MQHLASPLRVLVVAPRPMLLKPLPDRTGIESLYDAMEAQGEQIEAEWLWPPTWDAMVRQLESEEKQFSVVYLDAVVRQGDGAPALLFEAADAKAQTVDPTALVEFLKSHGVSLLILCPHAADQADMQALAAQMAALGGPHVMILGKSLSPENAGQALCRALTALRAFFAACIAGETLEEALTDAVKETGLGPEDLPANDADAGPPSQAIELFLAGEDIALSPGEDSTSSGVSKVIRFPSPGLSAAWRQLASNPDTGGLPPEPDHRFVGRGAEMAWLERALREETAHSPIWVYGYEGIGKTSLVAHVARWLVRTKRFERVVYTDFLGGGLPELALYDLAIRLLGKRVPAGEDPVEAIERALEDQSTLIIWDNMEAILPGGEFALKPETLEALLQLAHRYAHAGRSRLCLIADTRSLPAQATSVPETSPSLMVDALEAQDALSLLDALSVKSGVSTRVPAELQELIKALGGHPLALCVLAPSMVKSIPSELMEELETILPGFRTGEARLRNQALDVALEYMMREFGDGAIKLHAMGLFVGGFMEALGLKSVELDETSWPLHKERFSDTQLLQVQPLTGFNVPFVSLHPAFMHYLDRRIDLQQRKLWEPRYCGGYIGLLNWLAQTEGRSPDLVAALARCELPNFRRALRVLLAGQELTTAEDYVGALRHLLETMGLIGERDLISTQYQEAAEAALPNEGPLGRAGVQLLLRRGEQLYGARRVSEAGALFQKLCERMKQEKGLAYAGDEAATDHARALHRLGRCLYAARHVDAAQASYMQALDLLRDVQAEEAVRRETLSLYASLGEASLVSAGLDRAEDAFQKGLEIASELDDRQSMGAMSAQLGTVAIAREDSSLAQEFFRTALEHLSTTDDYVHVASIWSQLGALAWQESDLAEAERCYSQALELAKKIGYVELEARVSVQMARLAEQEDRLEDAKDKYSQAIRIYQEHNIRPALASAEMALADLLLREGELQTANIHAEAARAIAEGLENAHPWEIYALLRRIAEAEGNDEKVASWRLRTQEAFADSPEAEGVLKSWEGLIQAVAGSCRGEALDAESLESVEKLEDSAEWAQLAQTIWQILGGARGPELYAELDQVDALVVRHILDEIESPAKEGGDEES